MDKKSALNNLLLSAVAAAALILACDGKGAEPPVIPVGLDAYRQWERWPQQRIGMRTYMRSTYDRRGGNEGADASHFLYQLADDNNVTLDVEGEGILCFTRYNHWHGSPWRYVVDGNEYLVAESSTANPKHPIEDSTFLPPNGFPSPLALTWSVTKGADLSWVPIPFERSFRIGYSRTHYGTGYYIYQQFVPGTSLSRRIQSWTPLVGPATDVLDSLAHAGTDIAPARAVNEITGEIPVLTKDERKLLIVLTNAPAQIRKFSFVVPRDQALNFGRTRLRITWDNRNEPSVDALLTLFFGAGTLYNRDEREYLVKAFPCFIHFEKQRVELSCFFPMPFFKTARVELVGTPDQPVSSVKWWIRTETLKDTPNSLGYFHATHRDHRFPVPGHDLVLLDTQQVEGGGDWSGSFIGNSWIFSDHANLTTLECDPRFFFDDSQTPQAYGTGTEEWGGGGDYWGGLNMTLPFAGHPTGARNAKEALNPEDQIESAYRFLLGDLMPFGKRAVIRLEHGGQNESTEHYQTVTYWYGAPAPSLIKTDELKMADTESETSHNYSSPDVSAPTVITSRYEWGVDSLNGKEIYPAHTELERHTTGSSEFVLKLDPQNLGVLLRRTLDYSFPNQRAEVYVSAADSISGDPDWKLAGVWYLAGGNSCVYSNPKDELGAAQHIVQISNRRFRDDEFLVPRNLTQGRSKIRVRIKFTPVNRPLFPGGPPPQLAWSEIRYQAYCFVIPQWKP